MTVYVQIEVPLRDQIGDRLLVLFDGQCSLCNRTVRWLLKRDRRDRLRFASSDSPGAMGLVERHGIGATGSVPGSETILVVRDLGRTSERVLVRSQAVLALLGELPRPWQVVAAVLNWIPRVVLDLVYRLVARWRYRIGGRLESCPMPTVGERERFL